MLDGEASRLVGHDRLVAAPEERALVARWSEGDRGRGDGSRPRDDDAADAAALAQAQLDGERLVFQLHRARGVAPVRMGGRHRVRARREAGNLESAVGVGVGGVRVARDVHAEDEPPLSRHLGLHVGVGHGTPRAGFDDLALEARPFGQPDLHALGRPALGAATPAARPGS